MQKKEDRDWYQRHSGLQGLRPRRTMEDLRTKTRPRKDTKMAKTLARLARNHYWPGTLRMGAQHVRSGPS